MTNVEGVHLYADRLGTPAGDRVIRRESEAVLRAARGVDGPYVVVSMIDDYHADLPMSRGESARYLMEHAAMSGLHISYVAFEADCETSVDWLLSAVPTEMAEDEHVYHKRTGDHSVTTTLARQGEGTCPALAAVFMLARLGVVRLPKFSARGFVPEFSADRLLTVLPAKDMRVEATVLDLLKEAGYSNLLRGVRHEFH